MNTRKIAAFVLSSFVIVAAPQVAARDTGNPVFDECVIACLDSGGGVGGDGRMCNLICARELDSGNGNRLPGGPTPPTPPKNIFCNNAQRLCKNL
jgi:hypothetical protein